MDLNELMAGKCVTCADRRLAGREREFIRDVQRAMWDCAEQMQRAKLDFQDAACLDETTLRRLAGERKDG